MEGWGGGGPHRPRPTGLALGGLAGAGHRRRATWTPSAAPKLFFFHFFFDLFVSSPFRPGKRVAEQTATLYGSSRQEAQWKRGVESDAHVCVGPRRGGFFSFFENWQRCTTGAWARGVESDAHLCVGPGRRGDRRSPLASAGCRLATVAATAPRPSRSRAFVSQSHAVRTTAASQFAVRLSVCVCVCV